MHNNNNNRTKTNEDCAEIFEKINEKKPEIYLIPIVFHEICHSRFFFFLVFFVPTLKKDFCEAMAP